MAERLEDLRRDLASIVGPDQVLTDPAMTRSHVVDWTSRWHGTTPAVVRPHDRDEVRDVLAACSRAGVGVVPQGGNTSLVGGAVPRADEVVISSARLAEIGEIDRADGSLVVGSGVVLQRLQDHLRSSGFEFGVDLAARGSATLGGMAATCAGGLNVVAHGNMADNVLGIEAVLSDGRVIERMTGVRKDTAGYDLTRLMVGSEGTLGVITRLRLRLVPAPARQAAAILAVASLDAAVALVDVLTEALPSIRALELVTDAGMELVCAEGALPRPFVDRFACYVTVAVGGGPGIVDELLSALEGRPEVEDSVVGLDGGDVDRLLAYREQQAEAIARVGVAHKFDVGVPLGRLADFLTDLDAGVAAYPGVRSVTFGHLAEGNLHINILTPPGVDIERDLDELILGRVLELGGTISAEHGIGIAKAEWLERMRGRDDVATMRAMKDALDPTGMMNPGVIFATSP